tara:strand:+ start:93 stop:641 length:549 start_codon:yes stop_codon:yes gene_type:complete
MGTIKTTNIESISGSGTVTLGTSGETFALGAGVSSQLNRPAFEAYLSANQTISDATLTKVQFNTERFDTNSAYDNSSNYRFTIPANQGGKYFVYSNVQATSSGDTLASGWISIYKNGAEYCRNAFNPENSSMGYLTPTIAATMDLSATDYLEIFGLCSLASGTPSFGTGTQSTFFGTYKLGA